MDLNYNIQGQTQLLAIVVLVVVIITCMTPYRITANPFFTNAHIRPIAISAAIILMIWTWK
jgi:hypothetical protein